MKTSLFFSGDFVSRPSPQDVVLSDELKEILGTCALKAVGFEVPLNVDGLHRPRASYAAFCQHDESPEWLKKQGFNIIPFCNNHIMDCGLKGYQKTIAALGETFGSGTYEDAYKIKTVEVNGLQIGFMALCYAAVQGVFDDYYEHEGIAAAYINDLKVNHIILEAKKTLDYLFILPHDGIEYIDAPLPETVARYRDFIDYGADGVIASHPHCPQGWETYKGKPIFYSTGNFFFNQDEKDEVIKAPHWYEGRCVVLSIEDGKLSWEVINTRNVRNREIVVDHSDEAKAHNERICHYLEDKDAYETYLYPQLERLYVKGSSTLFDITFHQNHLKQSIKALWRCMKQKIKRQDNVDDTRLLFMLKNDSKRYRILRAIKLQKH